MHTQKVDWKTLLDNLEHVVKATSAQKSSEFVKLATTLDVLHDEIKSNDTIDVEHLDRLIYLFCELFTYPHWHLLHTTSISLMHVYPAVGDAIIPYLDGTNKLNLMNVLLHNIVNRKREVRDAVAQSLGGLSQTIGDKIFDYCLPHILSQTSTTHHSTASADHHEEKFEHFEGYMMSIGYLGFKCTSISKEHLTTLVDILITYSNHSAFKGYSNYIRLQATKGLDRIVRSKHARVHFDSDLDNKIRTVINDRLKDDNIDVRRAAAALHNSWNLYLIQTSTDPHAAVTSLVNDLIENLKQANKWEVRHGFSTAFLLFCQKREMVKLLDDVSIKACFAALTNQVTIEDKSDSSAYGANSVAVIAITNLFINLAEIMKKGSTDEDKVLQALEKLSLSDNATSSTTDNNNNSKVTSSIKELYRVYLHSVITFALKSNHPAIQDASGVSLFKLVNSFAIEITEFLDTLVALVYKNKFHASLPIRDGAIKNWKQATSRVADKQKFIASLTPGIVTELLADASSTSYEVRETVFKAFEELFSNPEFDSAYLTKKEIAVSIINTLNTEAVKKSGTNTEYPRTASIFAYSRFMALISTSPLASDKTFIDSHFDKLIALIGTLLADNQDMVVIATLDLIRSLVKNSWTISCKRLTSNLAGPILCLANSTVETIRFATYPVFAAIFGDFESNITQSSTLLFSIVKSMKDSFGLDEDNEQEYRDSASNALRCLSSVDVLKQSPSIEKSLPYLISLAGKGLLLESNRESNTVLGNSIVLLHALSKLEIITKLISKKQSKVHKIFKALLKLFLHQLSSKSMDDFEFSDDVLEVQSSEEDDDEEDEEEDGEDDDEIEFENYKYKKSTAGVFEKPTDFGFVYLVFLGHIVNNVLPAFGSEFSNSYVKTLFTLLSGRSNIMFKRCSYLLANLMSKNQTISNSVPTPNTINPEAFSIEGVDLKAEVKKFLSWNSESSPADKLKLLYFVSSSIKENSVDEKTLVKIYNQCLSIVREIDSEAGVERLIKGKLFDIFSTVSYSVYKSKPNKWGDHIVKASNFLLLSEEPDDEFTSFQTLPSNGVDLEEMHPEFVQNKIFSGIKNLLQKVSPKEQEIIFKFIYSFIANKGEDKSVENDDDENEEEEEEDDEESRESWEKLRDVLCIVQSAIQTEEIDTKHAVSLAPVLLENIKKIKKGDKPQDSYYWTCSCFGSVIRTIPNNQIDKQWITFILDLISQKWYRQVLEGKPAVVLTLALGEILGGLGFSIEQFETMKFLQSFADIVADEDVSGSTKPILLRLMQNITLTFKSSDEFRATGPIILPTPSKDEMSVKDNSTFAATQ